MKISKEIFFKNKKMSMLAGAGLLLFSSYFILGDNRGADEARQLFAEVKKGPFKVEIVASGELEAKNSVVINGPRELMNYRVHEVKLDYIVPEGTVVKEGDLVARLDQGELKKKIQEQQLELEKYESEYTRTRLDTTLQMREIRDQLVNKEYGTEEAKIKMEQSVYEPPATIKQMKINYEKVKRDLNQAKKNYKIKLQKNVAKMKESELRLKKVRTRISEMEKMMASLFVKAPKGGMVIYSKEWNGTKKKAGSTIRMWRPEIAQLPDLDTMVSKTYINEVDIRKVKKGMVVDISLDAYPDKRLSGKVLKVANVGEENSTTNSKVFEVNIQVLQKDSTIRPAMTTSNAIIASSFDDALYVPLEAIHAQGDSLSYVYKKDGFGAVKQQVELGAVNETDAIVRRGLKEGEQVYLSVPEDLEGKELKRLD